jgi:hypothetical protein
MMDIGMYGNHHTSHTSGFQSPDIGSGGYPYFASAPHHHHHIQSHQMHTQNAAAPAYVAQVIQNNSPANAAPAIQSAANTSNHLYSAHPHLYSPSAIEYGIHTTSANNSPSDFYEHGENYYNSGNGGASNSSSNNNNGSPMPENHTIISSDNGLSYTNLDYIAYQQAHGNQAYHHGAEEKVHLPHHYNEEMLMAAGQTPIHHGSNAWHHGYEGSSNQLNLAAMAGNGLTSQQISHSMHSPSGIQPSQSTSPTLQSQQQQQQLQQQQNVPTAPTYKWMQVKRNVPKPQSEYRARKCN